MNGTRKSDKPHAKRRRVCGSLLSDQISPDKTATENSHDPFCSARCKMQDLSKWFGESYRIASNPTNESPHEEE